MRVLHLTTEFPPLIYGGLGTAVGGLVSASKQAGVHAGVMLFSWEAGPSGYGQPGRSKHQRRPDLFEVSFGHDFETILAMVRQLKPDLLHLHSFWLAQHALQLRDRLHIPLVYTVHSLDRAEYEIGAGPQECIGQWAQQEEVIARADRVIALSKHELELISDYCPPARPRVRVVGNGIAHSLFPKRRPSGRSVVLFAGRFVARKGLWDFLDAIRLVEASLPGLHYVLAGGHRNTTAGEIRSWLLTPELKASGADIEFTGWLPPSGMADQYARADILIVPSWYEPFGMVVLEGMAHGLAIGASAVGGPSEILDHDRTGYLFEPHDSHAIARCIIELARNERKRRRIGEAGRREVREKWLWAGAAQRMQIVYDELLAANPLE